MGVLPHPVVAGISKSDDSECRLELALDQRGMILDARFRIAGTNTCIASTSVLTELIVGRHIESASAISTEQLGRAMDGLPETELQVPVLGIAALRDAYRHWQASVGEDPTLCHCKQVRFSAVRAMIGEHQLRSLGRVSTLTLAGTGCGTCIPDIEVLLAAAAKGDEVSSRAERAQRVRCETPRDRIRVLAIVEVVDDEIRPELRLDGGDMEVLALADSTLTVRLVGACGTCSSSSATLRFFVQDKLRELVDPAMTVITEQTQSGCGTRP